MRIQNLVVFALTSVVAAVPYEEIFKRAACTTDACLKQLKPTGTVKPGTASISKDCSSFMSRTITPCPTIVSTTTTITSTITATNTLPGLQKRDAELVDKRQATTSSSSSTKSAITSCVPITGSATALPTYVSSCAGTSAYSSACSCDGITTGKTKTLKATTSTYTVTSTVSTTVTPSPTLYTLQNSGDTNTYLSIEESGQTVLVTGTGDPFYIDNAGNIRNYYSPQQMLVAVYSPDPSTADVILYSAVPGSGNLPITCTQTTNVNGHFILCSASTPDGTVNGFGACPSTSLVYMPPSSNMACAGGYSFQAFYLVPWPQP